MSDAWQDWCLECVEEARGYATQNGTTIETAMLRILHVLMDETMARYPDVELSVAIRELAWWAGKADHDAPEGCQTIRRGNEFFDTLPVSTQRGGAQGHPFQGAMRGPPGMACSRRLGGRNASSQSRQRRSQASGPLILVAMIDSMQFSGWQGLLHSP
jgi:hypothetical protein